jgi:hypothetical protein
MGNMVDPITIGLQVTTLKTIVVTAVGCKSGVLLAPDAGNLRNFAIYNASGTVVGAYQIDKTVLDSTGAFVKWPIPPLSLAPGVYYFATTLKYGDYYNGNTVANSYTPYDSSVISALTGCYTNSATFPSTLSTTKSFGMFWVESFASIKVASVILDGGLNTEFLKANGTTDNSTYIPTSGAAAMTGNLTTTGVKAPSIDTFEAVSLSIGTLTATEVDIGRAGVNVNISNAYNLPKTAPQVGQVLTCESLGNSSWVTQPAAAIATIYPFPTSSRTGFLAAASRTYCTTYTMAANVTITQASVCLGSAGSDATRIGVYRGDLTTATLVGQTTSSAAPTSNYYTRTLTVEASQSLKFLMGEQIVVVYTTSGGTTTPAYRTMTSNIALATISSNTYTGGLPTTIANVLTQTVTLTRLCLEMA